MNKHQLKVAWLCPYPIDKLPNEKVKYNQSKCFHPASWLVHLSNALGKLQNIQLHIFTETNWVNKDYHFIHNNIYFHILKNPYKIPFFKRGFPSKIPISLITGYYLSSIKFLRKIKIIQPDLIHSHGTEGQYALFGLRSFYPLVISIQGVMKFMSNFNDMYQKKILYYENYSIKRAKNFGSRTEWVNNYIKSINPNANIYYMPEAINPVYFKESNVDRKDIIIYVGDLRERKGIIYLIRAFKEVTKIYSKYKLYHCCPK